MDCLIKMNNNFLTVYNNVKFNDESLHYWNK